MPLNEKKLLNIYQYHFDKYKAEKYVKHLAKRLGIPIPPEKDYNNDVLIDFGGHPLKVNFSKLVRETQEHGVPSQLQFIADSEDRFLRPVISIAIGVVPKGLKINIGSNEKGSSQYVQPPGFIESPETSLANDILYFRQMTCANSSIDNTEVCARYFRSYLLACVSIIDCFLSRYTSVVKELIDDVGKYENTSTLASQSGIEKRIEAWIRTFAYHEIDNYKRSTEWLYFQKIKNKRNDFVHPSKPAATYAIKEIETYLNYCNKGIGGLLWNFRSYTNEHPDIGFILKVKTAPKVTIHI
jgi:hypothetical protein